MGAGGLVVQLAVPQFAAGAAEFLHPVGVDAQRVVATDKDRLGAHIAGQRADGGDEGQRGQDDFVPPGDAGGQGGQVQRAGTGVAGYGTVGAQIAGQGLLKLGDLAAAGGNPAGGDGLAGQLGLPGAEIGHRKRDKLRHTDCLPL